LRLRGIVSQATKLLLPSGRRLHSAVEPTGVTGHGVIQELNRVIVWLTMVWVVAAIMTGDAAVRLARVRQAVRALLRHPFVDQLLGE
jgi:hypothetical protein